MCGRVIVEFLSHHSEVEGSLTRATWSVRPHDIAMSGADSSGKGREIVLKQDFAAPCSCSRSWSFCRCRKYAIDNAVAVVCIYCPSCR